MNTKHDNTAHLKQTIEITQEYAMRQAFLLLFNRLLQQQQDLDGGLSVTLEQAISGVQAVGGDIWLLEGDDLSLKSSAFSAKDTNLYQKQHREQFARSVVESKSVQYYDFVTLSLTGIGIPLLHNNRLLGVLSLYAPITKGFDSDTISFLEDFVLLASPVLDSMQGNEKVRQYVAQQQALLAMSRQIADGLGTDEILQHTLQWANRLCPSESGNVGLYRSDTQTLSNIYTFGYPKNQRSIPLQNCKVLQQVVEVRQPILVPAPEDAHFQENCSELPLHVRQILCIPLLYQETVLGVLRLTNKLGGQFSQDDINVLNIVGEVAAIALNNALLHARTVDLINEQERIYKMAVQRERLAIVGRLMRSLAHEINNPLQAVRGALALAQEDINSVEDLNIYFDIMNRETERIVQLLQRMRNIYRESGNADFIDINHLMQNIIALSRKELNWKNVHLETVFSEEPPIVWGQSGQLHIALLNILLALSERIENIENEEDRTLFLTTRVEKQHVLVMMGVRASLDDWIHTLDENRPEDISEVGFGLQFSRELISSHAGRIAFYKTDEFDNLVVMLPLRQPENRSS